MTLKLDTIATVLAEVLSALGCLVALNVKIHLGAS
jgi:hypothetical protein